MSRVNYLPNHYSDGRAAISVRLGETTHIWAAEVWLAVSDEIKDVVIRHLTLDNDRMRESLTRMLDTCACGASPFQSTNKD